MRGPRRKGLIFGAVAALAAGGLVISGTTSASAADKTVCKAARALNANFSTVDNVRGGNRDGLVSQEDVRVFMGGVPSALSTQLSPLMNSSNFTMVETATGTNADGLISSADLNAFIGGQCG